MRAKTYPKTTPNIMPTTRPIEPKTGSDEDMIRHGFHRSSPGEIKHYGKFVKREGFFSIVLGLVASRARAQRATKQNGRFVLLQTEGLIFPHDRQRPDQSDNAQSEGASAFVFREEIGTWQRAD